MAYITVVPHDAHKHRENILYKQIRKDMQKIMFNDKYGLTQAVVEGRKTMTRRVAKFPKNLMVCKNAYGEYRFLLCDAAGFLVDEITDWREKAKFQVGEAN